MQVVHTAGLPPSSGRTILPNIGSTTNNRAALRKTASVNAKALYLTLASDSGRWFTSSGAALVFTVCSIKVFQSCVLVVRARGQTSCREAFSSTAARCGKQQIAEESVV